MSGKETPATLAAARAKVPWRLLEYDHDPEAGAVGLHAAEALGLDPALVYKTLVAVVDGTKLVVGAIPVAARLNLKQGPGGAGRRQEGRHGGSREGGEDHGLCRRRHQPARPTQAAADLPR